MTHMVPDDIRNKLTTLSALAAFNRVAALNPAWDVVENPTALNKNHAVTLTPAIGLCYDWTMLEKECGASGATFDDAALNVGRRLTRLVTKLAKKPKFAFARDIAVIVNPGDRPNAAAFAYDAAANVFSPRPLPQKFPARDIDRCCTGACWGCPVFTK